MALLPAKTLSAAPRSPESAAAPEDEFREFDGEFAQESSTGSARKVFDPLRGYNRVMFTVNDRFYYWLLRPMGRGYNKVMPEFARASFDRAFRNLGFPQRFVSSLLQLKFRKAGTELGRFVVNSSLGVGGLWDPAERCLKWHSSEEDLGQALGYYGVGDGFPIVLPLLGQSNLRDLFAMAPATYVYPLTYVADFQTLLEVRTGEEFNRASLNLDAYDVIKKDALDPYTYIRDAYKQMREKKIKE